MVDINDIYEISETVLQTAERIEWEAAMSNEAAGLLCDIMEKNGGQFTCGLLFGVLLEKRIQEKLQISAAERNKC